MRYDIIIKLSSAIVIAYITVAALLLCSQSASAGNGGESTTSTAVTKTALRQPDQEKQPDRPEQQPSSRSKEQSVSPGSTTSNAPAEKSEFEKYVSGSAPEATMLDIKQFGYDLFTKPPSTFAPVQSVPVGPDYVVGPGDTLSIDVWGRFEGSWNVVVSNDGTINLPKIGVFGVSGLSFKELKEHLHKKLSKFYTGFEMNVSMGPLRSMQVYVVGNAQRPGVYTISSFSTIINALFAGGGPAKTGSMRNIQVRRNGRTVVTFDLYDFLLQGDKSKDIRLMPEDVILILPSGPLAGIAGNVKTPAIYELKGKTRLSDLIRMAGGLTGIAFTGRVQMQRIQDHQTKILFEGDLLDIENNPQKNFVLQDGDLAKVFTVSSSAMTARVAGAVALPGEFAVNPGVTKIKDVISMAGGLLYFASNRAEMSRITATQAGPKTEIFSIDLEKAMAGDVQHNVPLQRNDYLLVQTVPEWKQYQTVTLAGEFRSPGVYTFKQGETLSSLIKRAGGFTNRAYLRGTMFVRDKVREQQQQQITEMVERLERELSSSGSSQVSTASSVEDARMIQMELAQKKQFIDQLKVVKAKGRIALNIRNMRTFTGSAFDLELEQGDTITVPSDPKTVQVIGSVFNQSAFVYERNKTSDHYVDLAGGYTAHADTKNSFILKANGTAIRAGVGIFSSGEQMESGDTLVIPEQLERVAWMRNFKDITQIMYQIAVTAGVLLVLF